MLRTPCGNAVLQVRWSCVIFGGVQAYVSSDGCPSEHEAHRQVPTWRYDFKKRTVTIKHLSESNQPGSVVRQFNDNIGRHPSKRVELSGNWVTALRPKPSLKEFRMNDSFQPFS